MPMLQAPAGVEETPGHLQDDPVPISVIPPVEETSLPLGEISAPMEHVPVPDTDTGKLFFC